jgi:hypothetical protein
VRAIIHFACVRDELICGRACKVADWDAQSLFGVTAQSHKQRTARASEQQENTTSLNCGCAICLQLHDVVTCYCVFGFLAECSVSMYQFQYVYCSGHHISVDFIFFSSVHESDYMTPAKTSHLNPRLDFF